MVESAAVVVAVAVAVVAAVAAVAEPAEPGSGLGRCFERCPC